LADRTPGCVLRTALDAGCDGGADRAVANSGRQEVEVVVEALTAVGAGVVADAAGVENALAVDQVGALLALGADGGLVVGAGETGQLTLLDAEVAGAEGEAVSTEDAGVVVAAEAFVRTGLALSVPELVALSALEALRDVVRGTAGAVDGAPTAGGVG